MSMNYNEIDITKIKLVIWDLDETFWVGTLSEGGVTACNNIGLVKRLSSEGIINSICSKNDYNNAEKALIDLGINDFFVFKSIDWTPKGPRIKRLIKDMGLRPANVLFIDDNIVNLHEAKHYNEDLMIAEPDIIPKLKTFFEATSPKDPGLKRLGQYKVMQAKQESRSEFDDNLSFLYSTQTQVSISYECEAESQRIFELIHRTNQLNFTKERISMEELLELIANPDIKKGYVSVKDRFGDYGIVGFFAVKNNKLIHFLFSCRTIGQGVEQYVYAQLNYPELVIKGDVVSTVSDAPAPEWINTTPSIANTNHKTNRGAKIVFKGACDLACMSEYLVSDSIVEEFTYMGLERKNNIEHHNHSVNYIGWHSLNDRSKQLLVDELLFNDKDMFETHMFDENVTLLIVSTLIEPNLGIYQNKNTGEKIAFGEYIHPLTDKNLWPDFISNKFYTADNHFSLEWLEWFESNYKFLGALSPVEICENAKRLLEILPKSTSVAYILGPEIAFDKESNPNYFGREKVYSEINRLFRELQASNPRVFLIDVNRWVRNQSAFTNNINHWQRQVYFNMANCVNEYIHELTGSELTTKSVAYLLQRKIADRVAKTGLFKTKLWQKLRNR